MNDSTLNKSMFTPADADTIARRWRRSWSERSRSETVSKHGPGFFFWRSGTDGDRGSGMFYTKEMVDRVVTGSGMATELHKLIDEIDHQTEVVVVLAFQEVQQAIAMTVEKLSEPRDQAWFEMHEIRKRSAAKAVWVPLRASQKIVSIGKYGYEGYCEEFYGVGSVMFDIAAHAAAAKLSWSDIGISQRYLGGDIIHHEHPGEHFTVKDLFCIRLPFQRNRFRGQLELPSHERREIRTQLWAGQYSDYRCPGIGTGLVIEQTFNSEEQPEWHLHQDFVVALELKREGDVWVRPEEGYLEVIRLTRDAVGKPVKIEVRAEHLRDYLKARNSNLYISSYRSRTEICESADHISWAPTQRDVSVEGQQWEGRKHAIHEGGGAYGAETAVFHVARTDVDDEEDVPRFDFPGDANIESRSWTSRRTGRKLHTIIGELWRSEMIEPGQTSERILSEPTKSNVAFIVDESGNRESGGSLEVGSRWLWFKPDIVPTILRGRGSFISWYTRDTGEIGLVPGSGVHFGINSLGLLNIYAKDIAQLPNWQQRVWAGANVAPDGKVSSELLDSQMRANPATTAAPEAHLRAVYGAVNTEFASRTGKPLFRPHRSTEDLFKRAHRFRSLERAGLFELAKDLARLTVESLDGDALSAMAPSPGKMKPGSINHLEEALATLIAQSEARKITAVLAGINELRQADAHLPSKDIENSMQIAGISSVDSPMTAGRELLDNLVDALWRIAKILQETPRVARS